MLVNMPTTSIGNTLSNMEPNNAAAQGSCIEYNYLKRKLNTEDILTNQEPQQHQQQQHTIINENGNSNNNGAYPVTLWKKRHLEVQLTNTTANNFGQIMNEPTHQNSNCKNNNNNNNINADDLQFNIMSNAFINDLFSYDNNLIVPVTTTLTDATTVSYATPSSVNYVADPDDGNGNNWQAKDLLELDHRYNSALQPPIVESAAAPTATPNTAQINLNIVVNNHIVQQQQLQQQQQNSTEQQANFLVPQKQVSRSQSSTLTKYRHHFQLPQQHVQQSAQEHSQHTHHHQNHEYIGQQQAEPDTDFEDKNLSWLLNFKFDELPHLSPDIVGNNTRSQTEKMSATTNAAAAVASLETTAKSNSNSPSSNHSSSTERSRSKSPKTSTKASKKFEELVMEVTAECDGNDMIVGENVVVEDYSPKAQKKPPFTYTELIEYALEDKGELTVSGIYQWISDRFPFYKSNDDRWKNSVRHNLSINPHFRKGAKAPQGAGHLWTISSGDSAENVLAWEHKKQRLDLFFKMESMNRERIQEHQQKLQKQQQQQLLRQHQQQQQCSTLSALHQSCEPDHCHYDEAAAAAEAITQEMLQQTNSSSSGCNTSTTTTCSGVGATVRHGFHELPFNDLMSDEELRKTAGQILNGIHREVEVQSVNSIISTYHDVLLDSDYLNPIHKDVAVNESGLRNTCQAHASQYYITEIDPIELGIQMSHQVEEEVLFSDEFNLNYFGYNAGNDIVA